MYFQKRKYEEWKYILLKEKRMIFVLQLAISEWRKNKGQNTAIESYRRLVKEES